MVRSGSWKCTNSPRKLKKIVYIVLIETLKYLQGTLMALASFSEGKQIDKVRSAALLSPIAYLSHMTTALGVLVARAFIGEVKDICMLQLSFRVYTC